MKKSSIQAIFLLVGLLISCSATAQQKSLLWEISGNGLQQPSYLFGTYHLLTDAYLNELPHVQKAFGSSRAVMVEVEMDSSIQQKVMQYSFMTEKTIPGLITDKDDLQKLDQELQNTFQVGLQQFQVMKPSAIMWTLALVYLQQNQPEKMTKYQQGTPMDVYFLQQGKASGKSGITLETIDEQLSLLYDSYSLEEQAKQLVEFLNAKEDMLPLSDNIRNAYLDQDLKAMWQLNVDYTEKYSSGQEDVLIRPRNEKWVPKITGQIQKEATFIAVGALHLPGEYGLIELLKQKGYKVKAVRK